MFEANLSNIYSMVLVKCDRYGNVNNLETNKSYNYLVERVDYLTNELESNGIMLVSVESTGNLSNIYEFASIDNGWECALIITHGRINNVNITD